MVAKKTNKKTNTGAKSGAANKSKKTEQAFTKNVNNLKVKVKQNIKVDKKDIKDSANAFVKFMKTINLEYITNHLVNVLDDIKSIILNPVKFFSSIKADNDFATPVKTIFTFGLIAGGLSIILSFWKLSLMTVITTLILYPVMILIASFCLAGLLMMFTCITKGDMNFERAYKTVASQAFLFPIGTVLYKLMPTFFLLKTASIVMDFYVIILAYFATVYGLKGKVKLAQIVFGAFIILMILFYTNPISNAWVFLKSPSIAVSLFN
ncbi:MAG: hypothetical protein LBU68_01415 [Rickettsiales bacterium]|jgi:hypothetical protein|nr:hypothetical protein [Rickettsiales bacterium]